MSDLHWKTAITKIEPNNILLRGYRLDELMGKISFSQAVYLALKGELPSENIGKVIDAILVASIDHGATPPSTLTAITVASTGAPLNAALASGILAISKLHGGAIEECMNVILESIKRKDETGKSDDEIAEEIVSEYRKSKKRISGFGHRIHTEDPRTVKIFDLAKELGIAGKHVTMAVALQSAMEKILGKRLPINIDGAIAALLCEMEFPPALANAFFIIARVPGLVAHIYEEQTRQKPMRRIHPTDHAYDGPGERNLS